MDYMLYYVMIRSEAHDSMQYKHLIDLLDQVGEEIEQKRRVQSADRKNRPESASPETMKKRNLSQKSGGPSQIEDEEQQ